MFTNQFVYRCAVLSLTLACFATLGFANDGGGSNGCRSLPDYGQLKAALVAATMAETSGLNNQMWGTIVDKDGIVCAVAFTGVNRTA
jgi:hypothetical protein